MTNVAPGTHRRAENSHDRATRHCRESVAAGRGRGRHCCGGPCHRARRAGPDRLRAGAPPPVSAAGGPGRSRSCGTYLRRRARIPRRRRSSRRSWLPATCGPLSSCSAAWSCRAPSLAAELAAAGHEIGVHGFDHRYLTARGPRATRSDLTRATELIANVTGTRPRLFRPPYGVLTGPALLTARELGLTPVLWGSLGAGVDAGRLAAVGPADLADRPGRRCHRSAARLRLHLAAGRLAGRPRGASASAGRVRAARAGCRPAPRARRARGRAGQAALTGRAASRRTSSAGLGAAGPHDRPDDAGGAVGKRAMP